MNAVSPAIILVRKSTPHDHFSADPHGCVGIPFSGRIHGAGRCPTVRPGIISPAAICRALEKYLASNRTSPDDHFTSTPDCRVTLSGRRRIGCAGSCPTVRIGIISSAGIGSRGVTQTSPDDHFTPVPDRGVKVSARGRIASRGGHPAVDTRIISPATVERI